ncbi:MAG: hypothetical protein K2M17_00615 [Bacilli bacterium]|nr:hypothetical protein [Bacilli bacterium]
MKKEKVNIHNLSGTEKVEYAKEQLKIAIEQYDIKMIVYWNDTIINLLPEKRDIKLVSIPFAKAKAISSLRGIVPDEIVNQYVSRLNSVDDYDSTMRIIMEINNIVKSDWQAKITPIENYKPNKPYRLICQSLGTFASTWDETKGYYGNYISCSLLSNEQNDTYSGDVGFVYPADAIVAADSNDINLENRATNDLDVMRTQSIPTIKNIDQVITETVKRKQDNQGRLVYNEVGIRKCKPIAIFCKSDDERSQSYQIALSLQRKYPHLKIIRLPLHTYTIDSSKTQDLSSDSVFEYSKSDILNDLERQRKEAEQLGDDVGVKYYKENMKRILKENPIQVTPKQWDMMDIEQKQRFFQLKMKEAKLFNDKDSFLYWHANLNMLVQSQEERVGKRH